MNGILKKKLRMINKDKKKEKSKSYEVNMIRNLKKCLWWKKCKLKAKNKKYIRNGTRTHNP